MVVVWWLLVTNDVVQKSLNFCLTILKDRSPFCYRE